MEIYSFAIAIIAIVYICCFIINSRKSSEEIECQKNEAQEGVKLMDSIMEKLLRYYADGGLTKEEYEQLKKILEEHKGFLLSQ